MHKCDTKNKKKNNNNNKNKRLQVAFTHARVHMGASAYSPGPEESWRRLIWFVEILAN